MSVDDNSKAIAESVIASIFSQLGISRVICVDDEYAKKHKIEPIIALCSAIRGDQLAGVSFIGELAEYKEIDTDVFEDSLRTKWDDLKYNEKGQIFDELSNLCGIIDLDKSITYLSSILSKHGLKELSLRQWEEDKNNYLNPPDKSKTFILFDQDMIDDGGKKDEGILQIQNILGENNGDFVFLGILSNTGVVDSEIQLWKSLAEEYVIPDEKFVFISKDRLSKPIGFARMMKLATIAPECKLLKDQARKIYEQALVSALDEINKIDVYDFEHIVFHHSFDEGIWEPETLFRMFSHYHKKKIMENAKVDLEIEESTNKIRRVSHLLPPDKDTEKPEHRSWEYQHSELYDEEEFINSHHLPLELGDIFEVQVSESSLEKFVLLTQPCDLMVRKTGKRGSTKYFTLAKIEEISEKQIDESTEDIEEWKAAYKHLKLESGKNALRHELEYFSRNSDKRAYVCLNRTFIAETAILDFCVFHPLGISKFYTDDLCPMGLIPSWKNLYGVLCKEIKTKLRRCIKIEEILNGKVSKPDIKLALKNLLYTGTFPGNFCGVIEKKGLSYPVKRVGRINKTKAEVIMSQYTNYLARIGFERDVGKDIN